MKSISGPRWLPLVLAAAIALAGYFGPWVPHKAAGLVILGLDLAEYVKFLPPVASGQIPMRRELFYLPLLAGSVTASLLAGRRGLPGWSRVLLGLAAIPLALAMLPPAWSPQGLLAAEFRPQVIAMAVCLLLVLALPLTRRLPDRLALAIIAALALAAAVMPAWGFLAVRPAIVELYRRPLPLGWGFWAGAAGNLLLALFAVAEMLRSRTVSSWF
ncbi:MAG: hypothetical protein NT169_26915 [Chloroflexi bacterium]|nr:hypothetical protein [Chloroflexota bacterium]